MAQKITKNVGYFWTKICCEKLSKITKSGHTGTCAYLCSAAHEPKIYWTHSIRAAFNEN